MPAVPLPDSGPFHIGTSSSGILPAGHTISIRQFSGFVNQFTAEHEQDETSVGAGFWNLKLTENRVPDAGSTPTLLGMALGALGFILTASSEPAKKKTV